MHGEAFGSLLGLFFLGEQLANSSMVFFIDNLSVSSCLVIGSSCNADLSSPVYAIQFYIAKFNITIWFKLVGSKANVADGGPCTGRK